MTGLCLAVAGVVSAMLPVTDFTLAWTHSVEKIRWEEDYRVVDHALVPVAARVQGSGAGMEPPAGALLRDGAWHYHPAGEPLPRLLVTVSPYASDYDLCANGHCVKLTDLVAMPAQGGVVELHGCSREACAGLIPVATRPQ
jgi:hypothetical protein